jgi:signal transduction histidine kinase
VLRESGEIRWIESMGEIEVSPEGRPVRMVGTVRDVTARHEADEALRGALTEAQVAVRARDDLVSLVSHDLKSPLSTLVMGIGILESRPQEQDRDVLKRMARQAQRMSKMIDELLDVAQLRAGMPLDLELRDTDLVALTRALVEEYAQGSPAHRIALHAATESLFGIWDPRRLGRVVNNLLSNAVKYSPGGGSVRVELESIVDGDVTWASLRITDEGIGIAASDRSVLFRWFSRGQNARRTTREGTGIGLAGSRDIVEQHRGSITVESEEGKGSTFTVRLPVASPAPSLRSSAS